MAFFNLLLTIAGWGLPHLAACAAPPAEAILAEGLRLYQSERSSWVATDLLVASTIDQNQIGGYLSYFRGDSVRTIFWVKDAAGTTGQPLLASYTFPRQDVRAETGHYRPAGAFTAQEAGLFTTRQAVMTAINADKSPLQLLPHTSLNIVLLADKDETRAYVLTGPQKAGIVPIGNDYLLTYTAAGKLKSTERLHNSYLPLSWPAGQGEITGLMHSHLAAHPYITATDICSILLYRQQMPAHQHYVIGQEYVSLFDIDKQSLAIITRQAFEKMNSQK